MIDLRNIYKPEEMTEAGLVYHSIGRPPTNEPNARIIENPAGLRTRIACNALVSRSPDPSACQAQRTKDAPQCVLS